MSDNLLANSRECLEQLSEKYSRGRRYRKAGTQYTGHVYDELIPFLDPAVPLTPLNRMRMESKVWLPASSREPTTER